MRSTAVRNTLRLVLGVIAVFVIGVFVGKVYFCDVINRSIFGVNLQSLKMNPSPLSHSEGIDFAEQIFNFVDVRTKKKDVGIRCVNTSTKPTFSICVHPQNEDRVISRHLVERGIWESTITGIFRKVLAAYPNATFMDVGANIGYYSLFAATCGHVVVSVEPVHKNVERFRESVYENKLWDRITLVKNAISNTHTTVEMTINSENPGNIYVAKMHHTTANAESAKTATLDDLRKLVRSDVAIMKIDIENHECRAFMNASVLFRDVYIPYIFMEWTFPVRTRRKTATCNVSEAAVTKSSFIEMGYHPYLPRRSGLVRLDPETDFEPKFTKSTDVIWIHKRATLL